MTNNVSRAAMSLVGVGAMTAGEGERPGEKSSSGEKGNVRDRWIKMGSFRCVAHHLHSTSFSLPHLLVSTQKLRFEGSP